MGGMKNLKFMLSVGLIAVVPFMGLAGGPVQDPARVDAIAAWLPEKPCVGGARIDDRATWDRLAALPGADRIVKAAEKTAKEPVPDCPDELYLEFSRNGNRTRYQKPYGHRTGNLSTLTLAECLEGKGRFLPKIREYVEAICSERSWSMPAHDRQLKVFKGEKQYIDLGSGARALTLAFAADWLGPRLDPALVERIRGEARRRIFEPYLKTARNAASRDRDHWWYYARMNWNSVCHSTSVRAALALVEDRRERAEFVESAERAAPFALEGYTPDGYCSEGMGYWNYGWGHYLMLGLALREATGGKVDLFRDPKCRKVQEYAYGYQVEYGISPHFADGGGNPNPVNLALGRQIWSDLASKEAVECPIFGGAALDVIALRAFGQEPTKARPSVERLPVRTEFPDAQVFISRPDPAAKGRAFGVAVKGGHNAELHNHNDLGSYVICLDGQVMAGDPGGEIYTASTFSKERYTHPVLGSYGHPVPLVGGKEQSAGRKFEAKVVRTEFTEEKDTVEIDLTAGYEVPALKSLVRTLVYDRVAKRVTVTDRVAFSEPTAFESPVVTYMDVRADYEPGRFQLERDRRHAVDLAFSATGGTWKVKAELVPNPLRTSAKRLALAFAEPVTSAAVTAVFSAGRSH